MIEGEAIVDAITAAFSEPPHAVSYALTRRLGLVFAGRYLLESQDPEFAIEAFAGAGRCRVDDIRGMVRRLRYMWRDGVLRGADVHAMTVSWADGADTVQLEYVLVSYAGEGCETQVRFVAAATPDQAERFFAAVCGWHCKLDGSVLVFDRGRWSKSRELHRDIAGIRADELVLPARTREEILGDLQRFIDRRAEYDRFGVPWKRGVLLSGPPGNGKTMCIKVLVNTLQVPREDGGRRGIDALYVRSLASQGAPDHYTIGEVFARARRHTPCLLVFEDLDSLVNSRNRSVFLNELDGLAVNSGIVVVASTNHAERLDPALRSRPSRFDRTWHFGLPAERERRRFLANWSERVEAPARLMPEMLDELAAKTDGFSFAYLKELMLSSIMRWIDEGPECAALADVTLRQIGQLREQMAENQVPSGTRERTPLDEEDGEDPDEE